jgi:hypothetical protein
MLIEQRSERGGLDEEPIDVTIDKMKLNNNAYQNPSTLNPSTILAAIRIISALITKRKKPKVKMVTGIVRMIMIGLTTAFKKDNTAATTKAVRKLFPSILTPGKI